MRKAFFLLLLLCAAIPAHAAAQQTPAADPDSIPASARVVDPQDLPGRLELLNQGAVARQMERHYPRELREAGTRGRVTVSMVLDPGGVPRRVTVTGSSGVDAFDQAALLVTRVMRFTPPRVDGAPVWVRVQLPVNFELVP
jgi:TonB family protein